jgi:hypothetical protein
MLSVKHIRAFPVFSSPNEPAEVYKYTTNFPDR